MQESISKFKGKYELLIVFGLSFGLAILLVALNQRTNLFGKAAEPDKLETEGGTLSATGVQKLSDSLASGGQFVLFANASPTPTPTPATNPNTPTVTIQSPAEGATVPSGQVTVAFATQGFTIGPQGEKHLHFYLDNDPTPYMFYNGTGINEDNGVEYNGGHTHFVHWKSADSFDIFGLPSGSHSIKLVLSDSNHIELTDPEAKKTLNFTVAQPPSGNLSLTPMLTNLNFPTAIAQAGDGRIFFNERLTGRTRIINPGWQLAATPFCQVSVLTDTEQGLLGLALDPNFSQNKYVYIYYTAGNPLRNRVVRYTDSNGTCTGETPILDNLPANRVHNGGIIKFGPDGKLYVIIGDAANNLNSQDLTSLAGKVLRINPDGSAPSDNPFFGNSNANAKKVFSLGHRNSFGLTFHEHTGDLWQTENGPQDNDEINRIISGGNYGWPTWIGIVNKTGFIDPILAFTPVFAPTGIISIPNNSSVYPASYQNNLLFVDFNTGKVRRIVLGGEGLSLLGSLSIGYNGGQGGLLSLMLGTDGYIYVSSLSGIYRIVTLP